MRSLAAHIPYFFITLLCLIVAEVYLYQRNAALHTSFSASAAAVAAAHAPADFTARIPLEKYGLPGELDAEGNFALAFPPEIERVYFEIGLYNNPAFCDLPAFQPDTFVIAWEANEESWAMHWERCLRLSNGKYVALPFAAADSPAPLVWNTNGAQDPCASLAAGAGKGVKPSGWIEDPVARAWSRCAAIEASGKPLFLWDRPQSHADLEASIPGMMEACSVCKAHHAPGVNRRFRVPALSLETVLLAIPEHIAVDLVQIDAQGADLAVLESAKSQMHRIRHVKMEAQDLPLSDPDFLYGGLLISNASLISEKMQAYGFPHATADVNNCACLEYNLNFYRILP